MIGFQERLEEFSPEMADAEASLRADVERVAAEKGLDSLRWQFLYGLRHTGGRGGVPAIRQWGFQVRGVDPLTGEPLALPCFLDEGVLLETPALAAQILSLWLDRVTECA